MFKRPLLTRTRRRRGGRSLLYWLWLPFLLLSLNTFRHLRRLEEDDSAANRLRTSFVVVQQQPANATRNEPRTYRYQKAVVSSPLTTADIQAVQEWIQHQQQQQQSAIGNNHDNNDSTIVLGAGRVNDNSDMESYSSVDYTACCGLGHRLGRMSDAYHVAQQLQFELRAFWGWCGGEHDIFSHLFDPPLSYVGSTGLRVAIANTVPGYGDQASHDYILHKSNTTTSSCLCRDDDDDKRASDFAFFTSLQRRFRRRDAVERFVRDHFWSEGNNKLLSLSLHVRAGNGEGGDFALKQRQIADRHAWIQNVAANIQELVIKNTDDDNKESVLFVATDTPSYIDRLREALNGTTEVIVWDQDRPMEGSGVFFGEQGAPGQYQHSNPNECLRKWEDVLMDQMLLASADIVIAGTTSTFSQTLPLSLAFRRTDRKVPAPYCEVRGTYGEALACFETYHQWCCEDTRDDLWSHSKQAKRVRHPMQVRDEEDPIPTEIEIAPRTPDVGSCHPSKSKSRELFYCLPHDFQRSVSALK